MVNIVERCKWDDQGEKNALINFKTYANRQWHMTNEEIARDIYLYINKVHPEVAWQIMVANKTPPRHESQSYRDKQEQKREFLDSYMQDPKWQVESSTHHIYAAYSQK